MQNYSNQNKVWERHYELEELKKKQTNGEEMDKITANKEPKYKINAIEAFDTYYIALMRDIGVSSHGQLKERTDYLGRPCEVNTVQGRRYIQTWVVVKKNIHQVRKMTQKHGGIKIHGWDGIEVLHDPVKYKDDCAEIILKLKELGCKADRSTHLNQLEALLSDKMATLNVAEATAPSEGMEAVTVVKEAKAEDAEFTKLKEEFKELTGNYPNGKIKKETLITKLESLRENV